MIKWLWFSLCCLQTAVKCQSLFGQSFAGDGTFYGQGGERLGHCSLGFSGALLAPWTSQISQFVALNNPQYGNSQLCGLCLQLNGTGLGSGLTPVPQTPQYGLIADECPECKTGDLDLASNGDGRWKISWTPVQCGVGASNFQYSFQGSNQYYIKVSVTNARVPVKALNINIDGDSSLATTTRSVDNYFVYISGVPITLPLSVTLTSILGDTVKDIINVQDITKADPVSGTAQFPLNPNMPAISSGTAASPQQNQPAIESTITGQPALLRPTMPTAASGSVAIGATPPSTDCQFAVTKYTQCGGQGGQCGTKQGPCVDARWPGACCSTGFGCVRINKWWWQCDRSTLSGSTEAVTGVTQIPDYKQCGGLAAVSSNIPAGVQLIDGPWINTTCSAGFYCIRYDAHFYQCSDFPFLSTSAAGGSGSVESVGGAAAQSNTLTTATCGA